MTGNGTAPLDVRVTGIVRGVDIDRAARVHAGIDSITIEWLAAAPWELRFDGLDGVTLSSDVLTLYLHGGDLLELRGEHGINEFATTLSSSLHAMPEVTRGLRSLGSLRGSPGAAHDRWFAPLLAARRSVVGVVDPERHLEAFDAARLRGEFERAVEEIAATNAPEGGAHRRALEAALEEEAEPVLAAIVRLGELAGRVRQSPSDAQLLEWRHWVDQLRTVFAIADERWVHCATVLRDGP
jgi:hypothetical protein